MLSSGHDDGICCMGMASLGFAGMLRGEDNMLLKDSGVTLKCLESREMCSLSRASTG